MLRSKASNTQVLREVNILKEFVQQLGRKKIISVENIAVGGIRPTIHIPNLSIPT